MHCKMSAHRCLIAIGRFQREHERRGGEGERYRHLKVGNKVGGAEGDDAIVVVVVHPGLLTSADEQLVAIGQREQQRVPARRHTSALGFQPNPA